MLNKEQTDFLLVNAYNAAVRAGARIIDIYTGDADYGVDLKSDHTPITIADRESHELIKNYLSQTRIPLLSEEGRDLLYEERRNWDLFWMVDPLDGTKEFLKGNGEFTVNIALMCDNEPYIGIIYVPYIRTSNTYEWDTAAGEVILSEAGGVVEPFGGGTGMQYNKTSLHNPYFVCRSKFFR